MSTIAPYRRELKGPVAFTELVSCSKSAELTLRRRGTSRRGLSQARFHRGVVVQVRRERFVYPAGASPAPTGSSRSGSYRPVQIFGAAEVSGHDEFPQRSGAVLRRAVRHDILQFYARVLGTSLSRSPPRDGLNSIQAL